MNIINAMIPPPFLKEVIDLISSPLLFLEEILPLCTLTTVKRQKKKVVG